MVLRNAKSVVWAPLGLSDALDGSDDFPGAANLLSNLIPAQNQKGGAVARVAAEPVASLPDYGGGPINCLFTVGNLAYGMYASAAFRGFDRPFIYDMAGGSFASISGLSSSSLPMSPSPSGDWQPPTVAQIGSRVLFTHPGFTGGSTANTFWIDSVGNTTNGSTTLTGYPFYYGIPVGTQLSEGTGAIQPGTTVVSQTINNINVTASGTAGNAFFTVTSATGIFPGQPVFLPNGQWDTVASVSGTTINLNNITISTTFSGVNVTFYTSTILMSKPATATVNNLLIAGTAPVSNKFGWLDFSGFSTNIVGNINSNAQPIINGYFNVTGIEPGMTVTGANIPAGTTVRAAGTLTFQIFMTTTAGSTAVSDIGISSAPSPASYIAGTLQPGQLVQGPGLPTGTTFVFVSTTVAVPFGKLITGSLSTSALTSGTRQTFTVSASFIILSQLPTGVVNGASFAIAGGTPAAPLWGSGDLQGLALANVPVFVAEYGGSACFGVNTTSPQTSAVVISDAGLPCQCTNASQVLTFGGAVPVTAGRGLPLQNQLGGVLQSLIVFQGATNLQQITGVPALGNVTVNTSQVATGTLAPNSVAATPKGMLFVAPDGLRLLDFEGVVHAPVGVKGDGVVNPFVCAVTPSRIAASFSGNVYRVTVQWEPPVFLQAIYGAAPRTDDFWLHLDTGKFSGPHTCTLDIAAPWQALNSFICGLQSGRGRLWRSDPYPTSDSAYKENGVSLSWALQTVLLPDDAADEANAVVESSVWGSMNKGTSWSAALIDDQSQTQTTASAKMASATITRSLVPLYWGPPAAFRQASIRLTGPSEPQTFLGALRLRYQKLRYPLPAFPSSFQGSPFVATPSGVNVIDYGADPTGVNDSSSAFIAAMAAGSQIVIPAGTFLFAAPLSISIAAAAGLTFQGAGSEVSVLKFVSGNGFVVSFGSQTSTIRISGLTFATQGSGSGIGVSVTQTLATGVGQGGSCFYDCAFRGSDGWATAKYWTYCIQINGASNFDYINCNFCGASTPSGDGINIFGNATAISVVHNLVGCNMNNIVHGVVYGNYTQGVTAASSNFDCAFGIYLASGIVGASQLTAIGCQFGNTNAGGSVGIWIQAQCSGSMIVGNEFYSFSTNGAINIGNYAGFTITGNWFHGIGTGSPPPVNGIVINNYASEAGVIVGNVFVNVTTGTVLQAASQHVNVQANAYSVVTTPVSNTGTNNSVGVATT